MPIACPVEIRNLAQSEFDERDAAVMRCAYAAQNALGRLCDERVYENDLARRLRSEGFKSVHTQVPLTVSHDGFSKEYRLDLVADDALYELKTVGAFVPQHEAQALHYAMLADVNHVKLLNFRPERVQGQLKFNAFLDAKRRDITWNESEWVAKAPQCEALKQRVQALICDWGACLSVALYEEALVHFFGGEPQCARRIPVSLHGISLGSHPVLLHGEDLCFLATAFTTGVEGQRSHIKRLLSLTQLRAIQWINVNHTSIEMRTVQAKTV
jgi:GxxExxY protein